MGKLVLFLADGTVLDVPLDKERLTIGRRPDNDVCLPYPAVSGEHVAVVTILADSFLEDLGSTNGTLVNGKAVLKHFLRDNDVIDIGRQRLAYLSDNDAKVEPLPADVLRHQMLGLDDRVDAPSSGSGRVRSSSGGRRRTEESGDAPLLADLDRQVGVVAREDAHDDPPRGARTLEAVAAMTADAGTRSAEKSVPPPQRAAEVAAPRPGTDPVQVRLAARAAKVDTEASPGTKGAEASGSGPRVRVLTGPSAGRAVALVDDQLTLGRVGVQVAAVRRVPDGYRLVPLEGSSAPSVNGAPVAPDGAPLRFGDTFEVAGVRLELSESV